MHGQRGFSAVEMVVTVFAIGLILTASLTALNQVVPQWRLRQAANDIAFSLRAARAKAILEHTTVIMPFDETRGMFTIAADLAPGNVVFEQHGTESVRIAKLPAGVYFARPDSNPHPVWMSPTGSGGDEAASFSANGVLQSVHIPAYVYLGVPPRSLYRRVAVNLSGTVTIQRWDGTAWQ